MYGLSFAPVHKQAPSVQKGGFAGYPTDRPLYWHYPNFWGPTGPGIGSYSADREPAKVKLLADRLRYFLLEANAQMPSDKSTGRPLPGMERD